ncbi:LOB domain-containing protein [Artemisia annua]|uniref:LOB domain-containing protein n=1 Tax=Artemisia annua TaxID=35608 RepID=A0A2U1QCC2_ARTAN|nr:LOB domain-containing protein [Artemisia annua]
MASSTPYNYPCAACKFLRRKCIPGCVFAPYFPPEDPQKFMNVHKIFGASNVTKLMNDVLPHQREDVVSSLAYEAEARIRDPVHGCVGIISYLQRQVDRLQKDLDATNADLLRYSSNGMVFFPCMTSIQPVTRQRAADHFATRRIGGGYYQPPPSYYGNRMWNLQNHHSNFPGNNMSGGRGNV